MALPLVAEVMRVAIITDENKYKEQLASYLLSFFTQSSNDDEKLPIYSAYTGQPLRHDPSPDTTSIEAVYHYAVSESGQLRYYIPANVVVIEICLNWAKHSMSVMVLALAAETMRVWDRPDDWHIKRARLQWLVNATTNVVILHGVYGCLNQHGRRHEKWAELYEQGDTNPAEMLEVMHTWQAVGSLFSFEQSRGTLSTNRIL